MNRPWRKGRLAFAGLFLVLAISIYVHWPIEQYSKFPRMQNEIILGLRYDVREAVSISQFPSGCIGSEVMIRSVENHQVARDFDLMVNLLNLYTGKRHPVLQITCTSDQWFSFCLSNQTKLLALVQPTIRVFDLDTRMSVFEVTSGPGTVNVAFSPDDRLLTVLTVNKISVWDLHNHHCLMEFDCPSSGKVDETFGIDSAMLHESRYSHLAFNLTGRLLAVARRGRIAVYDLVQKRVIGETDGEGIVRFLDDGTLAITDYYVRPDKALLSVFSISTDGLKKIHDGHTWKETEDRGLGLIGTQYLTTSYRSGKLQCPEWTPSSISQFLQARWPEAAPHWVVSLRELYTSLPVKHFRVDHAKEKVFYDRFCGMAPVNPAVPELKAIADPRNHWLLLEDRLNLELWPLLTWWRPWPCWMLSAMLAFCCVFFSWQGFRPEPTTQLIPISS